MARLDNRIGGEQFLGWRGSRQPPRQIVSIDERDAVDGSELTLLGLKGRPFSLVSWVDCVSYEATWVIYRTNYVPLIESDPLELVVGGISSIAENFKVAVLDVRVRRALPITPGLNGLNAPSLGYLECVWDLIGVPL